MNAFDTAREAMAGKLTAAGVPATLDPAANVPFVLVDLVTVTGASGIGAWAATVPVKIVAAPPGDAAAARWLGDQLELVLRTLGAAPAAPGTYLQGEANRCPAYTVTYPYDVPNPDC